MNFGTSQIEEKHVPVSALAAACSGLGNPAANGAFRQMIRSLGLGRMQRKSLQFGFVGVALLWS